MCQSKNIKSDIIPPLEYAQVLEGNQQVVVNKLELVQVKAVNMVLGYSQRTSNAAVRAEAGIHCSKWGKRDGQESKESRVQIQLKGAGSLLGGDTVGGKV